MQLAHGLGSGRGLQGGNLPVNGIAFDVAASCVDHFVKWVSTATFAALVIGQQAVNVVRAHAGKGRVVEPAGAQFETGVLDGVVDDVVASAIPFARITRAAATQVIKDAVADLMGQRGFGQGRRQGLDELSVVEDMLAVHGQCLDLVSLDEFETQCQHAEEWLVKYQGSAGANELFDDVLVHVKLSGRLPMA